MKSTVKTALKLSSLLLLAGCWDCCHSKKCNDKNIETAAHANPNNKTSTCSHKGCTHDHNKDNHKSHANAHAQHNDNIDDKVEVQSMNDDSSDDTEVVDLDLDMDMDTDMQDENYSA